MIARQFTVETKNPETGETYNARTITPVIRAIYDIDNEKYTFAPERMPGEHLDAFVALAKRAGGKFRAGAKDWQIKNAAAFVTALVADGFEVVNFRGGTR